MESESKTVVKKDLENPGVDQYSKAMDSNDWWITGNDSKPTDASALQPTDKSRSESRWSELEFEQFICSSKSLLERPELRHPTCRLPIGELKMMSLTLKNRTVRYNFLLRTYYKGEEPDEVMKSMMVQDESCESNLETGPKEDNLKILNIENGHKSDLELTRHPNCRHSLQELRRVAAKLVNLDVRKYFIEVTYSKGVDPGTRMEQLLSMDYSWQKYPDPKLPWEDVKRMSKELPNAGLRHAFLTDATRGRDPVVSLKKLLSKVVKTSSDSGNESPALCLSKKQKSKRAKIFQQFNEDQMKAYNSWWEQGLAHHDALDKVLKCEQPPSEKSNLAVELLTKGNNSNAEIPPISRVLQMQTTINVPSFLSPHIGESGVIKSMEMPSKGNKSNPGTTPINRVIQMQTTSNMPSWKSLDIGESGVLKSTEMPSEGNESNPLTTSIGRAQVQINKTTSYVPPMMSPGFGESDVRLKHAFLADATRGRDPEVSLKCLSKEQIQKHFDASKKPTCIQAGSEHEQLRAEVYLTEKEKLCRAKIFKNIKEDEMNAYDSWRAQGLSHQNALPKVLELQSKPPSDDSKLATPLSNLNNDMHLYGKFLLKHQGLLERPDLRHPNCNLSEQELKIMSLKLKNRTLRHTFLLRAYYKGEDPDQVLKYLLNQDMEKSSTPNLCANEQAITWLPVRESHQSELSDLIRHPNCRHSKDELWEMACKLVNMEVKTYFVYRAYCDGVNPQTMMVELLSIDFSWQKYPDPKLPWEDVKRMSKELPNARLRHAFLTDATRGRDLFASLKNLLSMEVKTTALCLSKKQKSIRAKIFQHLNEDQMKAYNSLREQGLAHHDALDKVLKCEQSPSENSNLTVESPTKGNSNSNPETTPISRVLQMQRTGDSPSLISLDIGESGIMKCAEMPDSGNESPALCLSKKQKSKRAKMFRQFNEDQMKAYNSWREQGLAHHDALDKVLKCEQPPSENSNLTVESPTKGNSNSNPETTPISRVLQMQRTSDSPSLMSLNIGESGIMKCVEMPDSGNESPALCLSKNQRSKRAKMFRQFNEDQMKAYNSWREQGLAHLDALDKVLKCEHPPSEKSNLAAELLTRGNNSNAETTPISRVLQVQRTSNAPSLVNLDIGEPGIVKSVEMPSEGIKSNPGTTSIDRAQVQISKTTSYGPPMMSLDFGESGVSNRCRPLATSMQWENPGPSLNREIQHSSNSAHFGQEPQFNSGHMEAPESEESSRYAQYGNFILRVKRSPHCKYSLDEIVKLADRIPDDRGIYAKKLFILRCYEFGVDPEVWDFSQSGVVPSPNSQPILNSIHHRSEIRIMQNTTCTATTSVKSLLEPQYRARCDNTGIDNERIEPRYYAPRDFPQMPPSSLKRKDFGVYRLPKRSRFAEESS